MASTMTTPPPDLNTEVAAIEASLEKIENLLTRSLTPQPAQGANAKYLSGRWARRDGTVYAPLIPVQQQPGALVK